MTYALGNAVSVALLCALTCYLGYGWWTGSISGVFTVIVALVTLSAMNANGRLNRYSQWKREWDAMEGRTPSGRGFALSGRWVRLLIGVPTWFAFASLALAVSNDPVGRIGADLFWLATAVGVGGGIIQWLRSRTAKLRPMSSKDVPVSLCVKTPNASPDLAQAYRSLPPYCRSLIGTS